MLTMNRFLWILFLWGGAAWSKTRYHYAFISPVFVRVRVAINQWNLFRMMIDKRTCHFGVCNSPFAAHIKIVNDGVHCARYAAMRTVWRSGWSFESQSDTRTVFYKSMRSNGPYTLYDRMPDDRRTWDKHWTNNSTNSSIKLQIDIFSSEKYK